jgi:hypothetical protein
MEDLVPLAKRVIARHQHAGTFISVTENAKHELNPAATHGDIAELIADQQLRPLQLAQESIQGYDASETCSSVTYRSGYTLTRTEDRATSS